MKCINIKQSINYLGFNSIDIIDNRYCLSRINRECFFILENMSIDDYKITKIRHKNKYIGIKLNDGVNKYTLIFKLINNNKYLLYKTFTNNVFFQ